ncbi:dynein axonemal heavy chain 6-like [Saccostrea cucullata]|uniref:dynein axonemal heavy chain 6-like n=1 Tax=Saccostrea cuccullata TaxID=36930 RepID=UPI002ED5FE85
MTIYNNIARGLFEKDKLVFSFMMCVEIMKQEEKITPAEWNFFLRGAAGMDKERPGMPTAPFLNNVKVWNNAFDLNKKGPLTNLI